MPTANNYCKAKKAVKITKIEKLKLSADYLLLGERGVSRVMLWSVRLLRAMSVVLMISGLTNISLLYSDVPVLGAVYVAATVLLRLLLWSAELFRNRWFMYRVNGTPVRAADMLASFSVSDVVCAVKLSFCVRFYCVIRSVLFLALPLVLAAVSLLYARTGISGAVLAVLVCGNILLFMLAAFFCAAGLSTAVYAGRLGCFDKKGLLKNFRERLKKLDKMSFALLNFKFFFGNFFGIRKEIAGLIYTRSVLFSQRAKNE